MNDSVLTCFQVCTIHNQHEPFLFYSLIPKWRHTEKLMEGKQTLRHTQINLPYMAGLLYSYDIHISQNALWNCINTVMTDKEYLAEPTPAAKPLHWHYTWMCFKEHCYQCDYHVEVSTSILYPKINYFLLWNQLAFILYVFVFILCVLYILWQVPTATPLTCLHSGSFCYEAFFVVRVYIVLHGSGSQCVVCVPPG